MIRRLDPAVYATLIPSGENAACPISGRPHWVNTGVPLFTSTIAKPLIRWGEFFRSETASRLVAGEKWSFSTLMFFGSGYVDIRVFEAILMMWILSVSVIAVIVSLCDSATL